jgi:hypothetical protein
VVVSQFGVSGSVRRAERPVVCPCCRIPRIPRREAGVRKVCARCELHHGNTGERLLRKNADHVSEWSTFHAEAVRSASAEIERMTQALAQVNADNAVLQQQLEDTKYALTTGQPTLSVLNMLETERVRDAEQRARQAYRSRDVLAAQLWRLDALHNDADRDGTCRCGLRTAQCEIWKLLEDERPFLYSWEAKQVDRLREGLDHGLPDEHPEVARHPRRGWLA